jgi:hypothetical protein
VFDTDAAVTAPVAATVVNDPAAAVVPPMTVLSTVPPLIAWSLYAMPIEFWLAI